MDLFDKFMQTGKIIDYLRYRHNLEDKKNADSERLGHPRTTAGRVKQNDSYIDS